MAVRWYLVIAGGWGRERLQLNGPRHLSSFRLTIAIQPRTRTHHHDGTAALRGRTPVIPIVLVVGASGSGKTTLIERLVPALRARGLIVGTVKHASRGFDADRSGKDSARHFRAGAAATLLVGPEEQVLFRRAQPGRLRDLVATFFTDCDLVVAEGFSWERGPRVVVHRRGLAAKELPPAEETLVVVTDEPLGYPVEVTPEALEVIADAVARVVETGPVLRALDERPRAVAQQRPTQSLPGQSLRSE